MSATGSRALIHRSSGAVRVKELYRWRLGSAVALGVALSVPLLGVGTTAAQATPRPQWPAFHGNDQRTSVSFGIGARHTPSVRWHRTTSTSDVGSTPAIGKYTYELLDSGAVVAFNSHTGSPVWSNTSLTDPQGDLALGRDGTVYASYSSTGSQSSQLVALNPNTGHQMWTLRPPSNVGGLSTGPTVTAAGRIYVGTEVGDLLAISPPSGATPARVRWAFQTGPVSLAHSCDRDLKSLPAVSRDGRFVYVGSDEHEGTVWKINASNGTPVNHTNVSGHIGTPSDCTNTLLDNLRHDTNSTPALDERRGHLYIASDDGKLYALSSANLQRLWSATAGRAPSGLSPEDSAPAVAYDGTVVIGGHDNATGKAAVFGVRANGTRAWTWDESAACPASSAGYTVVESSAVIDRSGVAYIGTPNCGVVALKVATGSLAWRYAVPGSASNGYVEKGLAIAAFGTGDIVYADENGHLVDLIGGSAPGNGYWMAATDGGVFSFGDARFHGSEGGLPLNKPVVGIAATPDGQGYWLVASDGGVFTFGDAHFFGSKGGAPLNSPVVGMAATPDGGGYWLVASDGGVFTFGDAGFFGSKGGAPLNSPVVGMAAPDSGGYVLVASDGGVFNFGDAGFFGSKGGAPLTQPVVGIATTPDAQGYWLVASDGGLFTFGDAGFFGSKGGAPLNKPVVGMAPTFDGDGYYLVASDGGLFTFGDAGFFGSKGGTPLNNPVVGMAVG